MTDFMHAFILIIISYSSFKYLFGTVETKLNHVVSVKQKNIFLFLHCMWIFAVRRLCQYQNLETVTDLHVNNAFCSCLFACKKIR